MRECEVVTEASRATRVCEAVTEASRAVSARQ